MLNQAYLLQQRGLIDEAAAVCRRVLASNGNDAEALHLLGIIEAQRNNLPAALEFMDRAVALDRQNARFYLNRSLVLRQQSRLDDALESCNFALRLKPDYAQAMSNRGSILHKLGRFSEALQSYNNALSVQPDLAEAYNNRGLTLQELGQIDDALTSYERAVTLNPRYADAFVNRGTLLYDRGLISEALASYDTAIAINPRCAEGYYNRGLALQRVTRLDDALSSFNQAISSNANYVAAYNSRGFILHNLGRFEEAIASYRSALAISPDFPEALNNIGVTLKRLNRFDEALTHYDRALSLTPNAGEPLCNRGQVLLILGRVTDAIGCLRRAADVSNNPGIHSSLVFGLNFDPSTTAEIKQQERTRWASRHCTNLTEFKQHDNETDPDRRLRIGYVSSYFRRSASAYSFGGVITNHDRNAFEVNCFSDTVRHDDVTECIRRGTDRWHDTVGLSDNELAELIRRERIDILVDTVGHMAGNRLLVFAHKPAPVQVTAWGEPTGTGLRTIDFLLADRNLIPACESALLAEQVYHLPNFLGYWTPDSLPLAQALPASGNGFITLGSFNRLEKLCRETLFVWASVMRRLETARLILKARALENAGQRDRIQKIFADNGVAPERLELRPECDRATHFAMYREIDIALDPFPHSGGMTTLDALWMGVPVITCPGQTISSRLAAASLLNLGLEGFVARDFNDYIDTVVKKAMDIAALAELRCQLRNRVATSEFGDPVKYSRAVEGAYRSIWRQYCYAKTASAQSPR